MLDRIGVGSIDELLAQVPRNLQLDRPLDLPEPQTEIALEAHVRRLASRNGSPACFLGGGVYDHFVPSVIDEVVSRGEFYRAYTPAPAEASQGSRVAFIESQSLICVLTGMEVANASLYEGGSAVSEGAFMAMRVTGRHGKVVVLGSVHPEYRQVVETYLQHLRCEVTVVPTPGGAAELSDVASALDDKTACLIVQHPNFFSCLEDVGRLTELARKHGALSIVSFDPLSLGLLERPGDYGADIAVAEGQSLGIPMQYGGPFLGIMACRQEYVRKMPGRLVGRTTDRNGKTCYVLNLQAREQHIRREKATSNICTNQGLLALRATVYLSLLGKEGLREVATLCCQKAHYAAERLADATGMALMFDRPFFKEFVLRVDGDVDALMKKARRGGFDVGPALSRFPLGGVIGNEASAAGLLVAVTEQRTRAEIDQLVELVSQR